MRILLTFSINPEKGDQLIKEGRIGETMEPILEELQPEAAYFTDVEGTRGGFLVVSMEDASMHPAAESSYSRKPLFALVKEKGPGRGLELKDPDPLLCLEVQVSHL